MWQTHENLSKTFSEYLLYCWCHCLADIYWLAHTYSTYMNFVKYFNQIQAKDLYEFKSIYYHFHHQIVKMMLIAKKFAVLLILNKTSNYLLILFSKGSSIKYVRKFFRKTNISNPLIRTRTCTKTGLFKGAWLQSVLEDWQTKQLRNLFLEKYTGPVIFKR